MSHLRRFAPEVEAAIEILKGGGQRQDSDRDQLRDMLNLAEVAHCPLVAKRIRESFGFGNKVVSVSGNDGRIERAMTALKPMRRCRRSSKDQEAIMNRLAAAAGCYDAMDYLKRVRA